MSQAPGLFFSNRQHMAISPRLQHAIRLLQMSALEFEQELRNASSTNPFLEEEGDEPVETDSGGAQVDLDGLEQAATASTELPETLYAPAEEVPPREDYALPSPAPRSSDGDATDLGNWVAARVDLRGYLRQQLYASTLSERERLAAEVVIETVDDDGYLRDDVAAAAAALQLAQPLSAREIARGVAIVRGFDPAGVGAHDLLDCLSLQLQAVDGDTAARELALRLLREGADLLGRRDFAALRARLDCDEQALRTAYALIRRLDPRPGSRFGAAPAEYVVPDVIVVEQRGRLAAMINPALRPQARINQRYVELFRQCRGRSHPGMAQQLQEARWLLRNAEQRFVTIQRVAEAIVRRQRAFFVYGDVALKPMVLREVAEEVGLHESTVSRATGNKYMATPRGLFEFKHFFSRELPTRSGDGCSATAVRALMQTLIEGEDARSPLSDVTIADLLRNQGIKVARRTVAKYRSMMKVLPAELRRQA